MKKAVIAAVFVVMALYLGCSRTSREDLVVARVEGKDLTVKDFEHTAKVIDEAYLPDTNNLEGKKKVLDYMIAKEVMVLKAKDLALEKDQEFVNFWNRYRNPFLINAMTKYYAQKVHVTDQEVKDYYESMKNEFVLSQITVLDSMQAVEIRDKILKGADFADMAKKYSIANNADDGGQVSGTMQIGEMYWWVEEALLKAKEGDITLPVKVENGYTILKVHNRRKVIPDKDMDYARKRVMYIKQQKALMANKMKIAKDMHFQIFPDVLTLAYNSLPEDIPMGDIFNKKVTYKNAPKLNLRDEYKGMILSQYEGNTYTLGDFEYIYDNLSLPQRPRREQGKAGIVDLLYRKFFNDVLPEYIEKRLKLLDNPEIKKELDYQKEKFLINMLYNREILSQVDVTDKEIEDYYNEHKDEIKTKEQREFSVVINSDKDIIEQVKKLVDEGNDFEKLVGTFSEDPLAKQDHGNKGLNAKGTFPDFDDVVFSLPKEGAVSDPFKTSRGWAIVKLTKIVPSKLLSKKESKRAVSQIIKDKKLDDLFDKKVGEWRKDYNIEIIDKNLAKAKLERLKKD